MFKLAQVTSALIVVAALAFSASVAQGSTVIAPNVWENEEGYIDSGAPFNLGKFGLSSQRYQQFYVASQFPSSPIRITGMSFRPDYQSGTAFNTTLANVQINLSTFPTGRPVRFNFAQNVGPDDTVVHSGPLQLSSAFTGPAEGPKQFDISINFFTPFDYNPAAGNLLVDVRNFEGGTTTQFDSAVGLIDDYVWFLTTFSTGNVNSTAPDFGDYSGLVTQFTYTNVPEPSTLILAALGLIGFAAWGWRKRPSITSASAAA